MDDEVTELMGFRLVRTCVACPEQYDVFRGGAQVGYLRLRHGYFSAETPDVGGKLVYEARPKGDGIFESDERIPYLVRALEAVQAECGWLEQ